MSDLNKLFIYLGVVLLFGLHSSKAQDITRTNWYFGNSDLNLLFDKNGRRAVLETKQNVRFSKNGSVVINDQFTGNLLFYTDGQVIYDASQKLLPSIVSGSILSGDTSYNQPVVVSPNPNNNNEYYLFTNSQNELQYSLIDASIAGNSAITEFPLGEVSSYNLATGLPGQSEGMKVLPAADGNRFFVITQDPNDYSFNIIVVSSSGLTNHNEDVIPSALPDFEVVQMAFNADSSQLALAPKENNRNILIFDVNLGISLDTAQLLSFNRQVLNTAVINGTGTAIHDVEWSPDGQKLFFSKSANTDLEAGVYQVDFSDTVNVPSPVIPIMNFNVARSYGLERGIDDRIYHLYQLADGGEYSIGRILNPDSVGLRTFYDSIAFEGDFKAKQFPQFASPNFNNFSTVEFTYRDSCQAQATKFFANVSPEPNNYLWDFGDGNFSSAVAPIHTYENEAPYVVTLITELNGRIGITKNFVEIFAADTTLNLGNDTTICVDEILTLDAGDGTQYLWNTGASTATIEVDTAGTYWVEVAGTAGCTSYDEIIVTEYGASRQFGAKWYFGENAGLDFINGTPQVIIDDNLMSSPEGCASVSDINGQLVFYTNGATIWNRKHEIMINGTNIGGDSSSTQAALILPFQDDNTMFYVFITEQVYGDFEFRLKYAIVDMKFDSAYGKVILKDFSLVNQSTERVTSTGFTGNPYLLTHEYGNPHFRSYFLSRNGIGPAQHTGIGESHSFQNESAASGYTKFSPGGQSLAMLVPGDTNYVEIFDYNFASGAVSNPRLIDIEEYGGARAYGLEYSGDGLKLYITTSGTFSKLIQYDLDSLFSEDPVTDISATKYAGYPVNIGNYGALQRGSDGLIYLAVDNTTTIGEIASPAGDDAQAVFNEASIDIDPEGEGRLSRLGLPNFSLQSANQGLTPSIATTVGCVGLPTAFTGQGRDTSIEEYTWEFGDGLGSTEQNVDHTYDAPGEYFVTLTLTNRCDTAMILRDTVSVFSIPEAPMVGDTSICEGQVTLSAWDVDRDNFRYYWSTGDTTRTITLTADLFEDITVLPLDVAIINSDGCSSDTLSFVVGDGFGIIDLGEDQIACQRGAGPTLTAQVPGPNYTWFLDDVRVGTAQSQVVDTRSSGTFMYRVEVFNAVTGCLESDSVEVLIQPSPTLEQNNIIQPDCGLANGEFEVSIESQGNFTYQLDGPVSLGPFNFDGPGAPNPFTGLEAGSYITTVTNNNTGCVNTEIFQLENEAAYSMDATAQDDCFYTGDISINIQNLVGSLVDLEIFNREGERVYNSLSESVSRGLVVNDLDTGLYYVQITEVNLPNCVQTDTVQLTLSDQCFRRIQAPNAFSPGNQNGLNDNWSIIANDFIDRFEIFIYNRWGRVIYYSQDPNFEWDGDVENKPIGPGLFAYKIIFSSELEPELGLIEQYGSVAVIR